ncbi:MAG TPA: ATP-binding protein [Planctomycetaceae bacterium]|nr:ATP-binding protein [Planctomycetaceae bacterium]
MIELQRRLFWILVGPVLAVFGIATLLALLAMAAPEKGSQLLLLALIAGTAMYAVVLILRRFVQRIDAALAGIQAVVSQTAADGPVPPLPLVEHDDFEELSDSLDRMRDRVGLRAAQLQDERDRLRTVINAMTEGVVAVNADSRVLLVNTAACELFKLREPTAVGRPIWELVRNQKLQQWVSQTLERHELTGGEIELLDPAFRILVINVAPFPVQPLPGAVIVAVDVTALRRLERVRQEFVANASHELKTPLASITACCETLLDGASEDPQFLQRFLQTIHDQANRLDALVRDMLMLARVESEALTREPKAIAVFPIVELCLNRHHQAAERKQLAISVDGIEPDFAVMGDEEALEQILDNLLDNAIKYSNPTGSITLRSRRLDGDGILEVQDTGIGIPQAQLPRIFERFYRVDRHRSREIGGTGLGLSIVKHLVQAMGGSVSVDSRLHEGSTFAVRLPLAAVQEIASAGGQQS